MDKRRSGTKTLENAQKTEHIIHSTNRFEALRAMKEGLCVDEDIEPIFNNDDVNSATTAHKRQCSFKTRSATLNTFT